MTTDTTERPGPLEIRAAVVHLLMPRGEIACGDGPGMLAPQADINRVTCPECIEHHDSPEETTP